MTHIKPAWNAPFFPLNPESLLIFGSEVIDVPDLLCFGVRRVEDLDIERVSQSLDVERLDGGCAGVSHETIWPVGHQSDFEGKSEGDREGQHQADDCRGVNFHVARIHCVVCIDEEFETVRVVYID
jgi:hypothetical protein